MTTFKVQQILKQVEQIYQSMNIYNALFVRSSNNTAIDNQVIHEMEEQQYPIVEWYKDIDFLNTYRILVIELHDLVYLKNQMEFFTLVMTTTDTIFNQLMENPLCENATIVKL